MGFRQFVEYESNTYTYLIFDENTLDALLIDPVVETVDRDLEAIRDLRLNLKYILETHIHADHHTGAGEIRKRTGCQVLASEKGGQKGLDRSLKHNEILELSSQVKIKCLETPGHTNSCMSYFWESGEKVFTGDTLLIRGCGRTDFQEGSNENLYHSVRSVLFELPDTTLVYPGHDYKGRLVTSISEEKEFNPRLGIQYDFSYFENIMKNLNLSHPKKLAEVLPLNQDIK